MVLRTKIHRFFLLLLLLSLPLLAQDLIYKDSFEECDPANPTFCPNGEVPELVSLVSIDLVELQGRAGHEMLLPTKGDPITDTYDVIAKLSGPIDLVSFELVRSDGTSISPIVLVESEDSPGTFFGSITLPTELFRFQVSGLDLFNREYLLTAVRPYSRQTVQVTANSMSLLSPGSSGIGLAYVTNYGPDGDFTVRLNDNQSVSFNISQPTVAVKTGETASLQFDFSISSDTPKFSQINYRLFVENESNPTVRNSSNQTIRVLPTDLHHVFDYLPGDCADLFLVDSTTPVVLEIYGDDLVDLANVDTTTILLGGLLPANDTEIGDFGSSSTCDDSSEDGFPDLRLTYDAADFQLLLESNVALSDGMQVLLPLIGETINFGLVVAYGIIRVEKL